MWHVCAECGMCVKCEVCVWRMCSVACAWTMCNVCRECVMWHMRGECGMCDVRVSCLRMFLLGPVTTLVSLGLDLLSGQPTSHIHT